MYATCAVFCGSNTRCKSYACDGHYTWDETGTGLEWRGETMNIATRPAVHGSGERCELPRGPRQSSGRQKKTH